MPVIKPIIKEINADLTADHCKTTNINIMSSMGRMAISQAPIDRGRSVPISSLPFLLCFKIVTIQNST